MRFRNSSISAAAENIGNGAASYSSEAATADYQDSSMDNGYRLPLQGIRDIVDAEPLPTLSFSPHRDKILFLKRSSLPPLAEMARPEQKLAGIRIDGKCNSRTRMAYYYGIGVHHIMDDGTLGPEKEIHGLPTSAKINFVSWSTDGQHLSFSVRTDEEDGSSSMLRVWVSDIETCEARPLFHAPDIFLNAVFDK